MVVTAVIPTELMLFISDEGSPTDMRNDSGVVSNTTVIPTESMFFIGDEGSPTGMRNV